MELSAAPRKLLLALHITLSVGWVGAVAAYIALDVSATVSRQLETLRMAYLGMDLIAGTVLVPLAIAALLTGMAISLGTKWGLFRHWWVVISLLLTLVATVVLLQETNVIRAFAAIAADPTSTIADLEPLPGTLPHSVGGTVVLLVVLVLNVYKPRGLTPHGWRMQQRRYGPAARTLPAASQRAGRRRPRFGMRTRAIRRKPYDR